MPAPTIPVAAVAPLAQNLLGIIQQQALPLYLIACIIVGIVFIFKRNMASFMTAMIVLILGAVIVFQPQAIATLGTTFGTAVGL